MRILRMFSTAEAAKLINVSKSTVLRWIHEGLIADVDRDWRGWRTWSQGDINTVQAFKETYHGQPIRRAKRRPSSKLKYAKAMAEAMSDYGEICEKRRKNTQ